MQCSVPYFQVIMEGFGLAEVLTASTGTHSGKKKKKKTRQGLHTSSKANFSLHFWLTPTHAGATDVSEQRMSFYVRRSQKMPPDSPCSVFSPVEFRTQASKPTRGKTHPPQQPGNKWKELLFYENCHEVKKKKKKKNFKKQRSGKKKTKNANTNLYPGLSENNKALFAAPGWIHLPFVFELDF